MGNPILFVKNAGHGETPVPKDALLKLGAVLNIHNADTGCQHDATVIAICPVGTPVEYAIADQCGEPRPLMITKPRHREPLYVLDVAGKHAHVLHSAIARGLNRAREAGLNG